MSKPAETIPTSPKFQEGVHTDIEQPWLSRFHFLKEQGYLLRARYRPGWVPSWKATPDIFELQCEDGIHLQHKGLIDAQRISDGQYVMMKEVGSGSKEAQISSYLSSDDIKNEPRNHAVPLLDVLQDVVKPDTVLLVFPLLRHITDPAIASVSEALDLVDQTLEGLVFLHEHEVAHRDCAFGNIMMDGRALFQTPWHPQVPNFDLQNKTHKLVKSRTDVGGVPYYFTDFGLSTKGENQVTGLEGLEPAPELSDHVPYNPYKLDVYILGKMYHRKILDEFINANFLEPLVKRMTAENPEDRPSAAEAHAIFRDLRSTLNIGFFSQRLLKKEENMVSHVFEEIYYWLHVRWAQIGAKPALKPFR